MEKQRWTATQRRIFPCLAGNNNNKEPVYVELAMPSGERHQVFGLITYAHNTTIVADIPSAIIVDEVMNQTYFFIISGFFLLTE